jgi:uncharacterized membrane protein YadS
MRAWLTTEDWWAVWIGLSVVVLALLSAVGADVLGWAVNNRVWLDPWQALAPVSKTYADVPPLISALVTYVFLLAVLSVGAHFLKLNLRRFALGFTVVFWVSFLCWTLGHFAYIAATPDQRGEIPWSLGLTGEAGFIVALLAGLVLGNFFPGVTAWLREATRPEWFIKTAIVIMGAALGVKAAGATGLFASILFRGFAAIIEAYLIYWALVYFIARRYFKFSREWAAPLASGISICGVSAAIATGAAIRARPVVPVMVSSLVVVFSVVELIFLPLLASVLGLEPLVVAAWMGLAVKTDGAAVASGAIAEALLSGHLAEYGLQPGLMLATTTTVKIFIDIFIGVWAFILALIWVYRIDKRQGETVSVSEIWLRFPKFVLGYFLTFLVMLGVALAWPSSIQMLTAATGEADVFRRLFFVMTFFTIGLTSNFRRLWAEGIGRLALVYVISLFGFIIWIGLLISWLFFSGVYPTAATSGVP